MVEEEVKEPEVVLEVAPKSEELTVQGKQEFLTHLSLTLNLCIVTCKKNHFSKVHLSNLKCLTQRHRS